MGISSGYTPLPAPVSPPAPPASGGIVTSVIMPPGSTCPLGYGPAPVTGSITLTLDQQIAEALGTMQVYPEGNVTGLGAAGSSFGVVAVAQYITPDDCFRVDVLTTVPLAGLWLTLRTINDQGQINYTQVSLDLAALNTLTTTLIPLSKGWLLNATVSYTGGGLVLGTCLVSFGMQHSSQPNMPWELVLSAGYVSSSFGVAWPSTASGTPPTATPPAPGAIAVRQAVQTFISAKPISATFPLPVLAGSMLLVNYATRQSNSISVSIADTLASPWLSALPATHSQYGAIWFARVAAGGADTVTATETAVYDQLLQIWELTGFGASPLLVANANGADATTLTPTCSTQFAAMAGDWCFSSCWIYNSNASITPRAPFVTLQYEHAGVNPLALCGCAYTVNSPGVQTETYDLGGTGNASSASIAVFRGS